MTLNPEQKRLSTRIENEALTQLEDAELVELCLRQDQAAWRELVRRFEPLLRFQVGRALARAMKTVMASDAVDDVIGDLYVHILEEDMRKLRVWLHGGRGAALGSWLTMMASGIAIDHWRHTLAGSFATSMGCDRRPEADRDPNRGGTWIEAERRATCEPPKKRRRREPVR